MITLAALRQKAERAWLRSLRARLASEPFFPWVVPFRKFSSRRDDFACVQQRTEELVAHSKAQRGSGYTLVLETRNTRSWGRNQLPRRIIFETAADLDEFLKRRSPSLAFDRDATLLLGQFPQLRGWALGHVEQIVRNAGEWPDLLKVLVWFVANPRPELFVRELPIAVHTKFIEEHRGILHQLLAQLLPADIVTSGGFEERFGLRKPEPEVRLRFLDKALCERLGFPFERADISRRDFTRLPLTGVNLLITENEITFLTLPPLPNTLGVFGSGFAVGPVGHLEVLQTARVFYWGDLDAHGFQILATLRRQTGQTVALMMDRETLETFREFVGKSKPTSGRTVEGLTVEERRLFEQLADANLGLEQEKIPHAWAVRVLRNAISGSRYEEVH